MNKKKKKEIKKKTTHKKKKHNECDFLISKHKITLHGLTCR